MTAIIVLIPASLLMILWIVLLCMSTKEDWLNAAYGRLVANMTRIDSLRRKDEINAEKLSRYHGVEATVMRLFLGNDSAKEIAKLEKKNERIQGGDLNGINLFEMPGYVLQRKFSSIGRGRLHKTILEKNIELYGKKYAEYRTDRIMAQILSYPLIGVSAALMLGALFLRMATNIGIGVMGIGSLLVAVLVYAVYDELNDKLNRRRTAISRQFPNVVSKLALLVTSGMIMDRAWQETAGSQNLELYLEMRKTSEELSNLVDPMEAYGNFIDRCNTKETTKLASAIMQNLSKGNAEIGLLLKNMAHEAWQERRHTAKRDSEAANSKLMIPTMLLFLAILIMIMVPVFISFTSLM